MAKRPIDTEWKNRIKKASEKKGDFMSAIIFGAFGSGKTKFCGTWPKPFFIAAEDGLMTLSNTDIPYIKLENDKAVYQTVLDILVLASQKREMFEDVETIIIDSMSKLNRLMLDEILDEVSREKPEFDEWGKLRARMNKLNNLFVRLPMHRLITISEAFKEDQESGDIKPTFNIEGGFRNDVAGEYDNVWWFSGRQVGRTTKYFLNTSVSSGRAAKTRLNLPIEIENPTFAAVMASKEQK